MPECVLNIVLEQLVLLDVNLMLQILKSLKQRKLKYVHHTQYVYMDQLYINKVDLMKTLKLV